MIRTIIWGSNLLYVAYIERVSKCYTSLPVDPKQQKHKTNERVKDKVLSQKDLKRITSKLEGYEGKEGRGRLVCSREL